MSKLSNERNTPTGSKKQKCLEDTSIEIYLCHNQPFNGIIKQEIIVIDDQVLDGIIKQECFNEANHFNEDQILQTDLDIESIDQFIILDDNVDNNNINLNNNFVNIINNLNNCDTDELVSFETVVENYDSNDTSTIISNEHVLTPDNDEQSVEVEIFGKKKRKKDDRVNKLN
ncbi:hypothetical protein QTP88_028784 [Uroleucon formosanum]